MRYTLHDRSSSIIKPDSVFILLYFSNSKLFPIFNIEVETEKQLKEKRKLQVMENDVFMTDVSVYDCFYINKCDFH